MERRSPSANIHMTVSRREGAQTLRKVLGFTFRLWQRRPRLAGGLAIAMSLATVMEIFIPLFAGRLIDALTRGPGAAMAALHAFIAMAVLGLAMIALRQL